MSILPIDVQVNAAQVPEVGRTVQAQADAPSHLQTALAQTGLKEAERQKEQVQETPDDKNTGGPSGEGTGRGRAFLRQHGERKAGEEEEEAAAQEPGKGLNVDRTA